jgi:hypothetical protein
MGYTVLRIYELMVYSQSAPLLADYMKVLGREKNRFEGVPVGHDRVQHANLINEKMGFTGQLELKPEDFIKDNQKKKLAKLNTVAFLGKLLQSNSKCNTKIVYEFEKLVKMFYSETTDIVDITALIESAVTVTTKHRPQHLPPNLKANVVIGAMVLAGSKVILFKNME